ncbi:MAG: NAD(P)-dependent oxidoreductase [Planctomycetota bacterium]|jgi:D-3-phosphoglycerate dehydrogenase
MSTATSREAAASEPPSSASTFRVLIADPFEPVGVNGLEALGCAVTDQPELTPETLGAALSRHDPDVLVVRSTKVPEQALASAARLSLIVRAGAGYDNIDVEAASKRGIFVANCPGKNAIAVAELVWGLILCCDRRLPDQTADLRAGAWKKGEYGRACGLHGRTLGIVGTGRIGREVAARARAFGMKTIAWSRSLDQDAADELGVGYCSSLINLAKMADVVSLHVAATPGTEKLINETFFSAMKDGAYLINTSRGSVVDEKALVAAIRSKGIRAGLDVYADQPAPGDEAFTNDIVSEPGVYGTHHCGASTEQAQNAVAMEVVRVVREYFASGAVPNCVNRAATTPATTLLTVRHLNRPGVLAQVFYTLGQAGINVEDMENIIYEGHAAACARIHLDAAPNDEHVQTIRANDSVLSVEISGIPEQEA